MDKLKLRQQLKLTLVTSRAEANPRTIVDLASKCFEGGATALQLREKNISDRDFYEEALALRDVCQSRGCLFIINDRLDVALAVGADGLHVGQSDLPAQVAARLLPKNKILGVSVRTVAEAQAALEAGADYLGVGAMFATGSKNDVEVIDPAIARAIVALGAPCVAIGGLTVDNAPLAWKMGFDGLAVISALTQSAAPQKTARLLLG